MSSVKEISCSIVGSTESKIETLESGRLHVAVTNRPAKRNPLSDETWMVDLVEGLAGHLKLSVVWHDVPFDRSWLLAGQDKVDIVATNIAAFDDRVSKGGSFSAPFMYERRALRIRARDSGRFISIADLKGCRVGAVCGMAAHRDLIRRAPAGVEVVAFDSFTALYEAFHNELLHAVAQAEYYAMDGTVIPSHGADVCLIDHHDMYDKREECHLVVRDKSTGLLAAVNAYIKGIKFPPGPYSMD